MDLNHIVSFLRVVAAGSFTGAARSLGVPTSTVSRQIAQLEETLGVRLLQRTSRQVQLTEAGMAYYERVAPAIERLEGASAQVRDLQETPSGFVKMTAPTDLSIDLLAEPLAKFAQLYPRIQVELMLTGRTVDMVTEGVDLALRAGKIKDESLVARKIGFSDIVLAATPAYLARRGEPASLDDLRDHDCIGFRAQRGHTTWSLQGPEGHASVELESRVSADDYHFVRALLLADAGIAYIPSNVVDRLIEEGQLRRVLPGFRLQIPGGLHLVYPSAKHLPRRVALLRDFLLQTFATIPYFQREAR